MDKVTLAAVPRGPWGLQGDLEETGGENSRLGAKGKDLAYVLGQVSMAAPQTLAGSSFAVGAWLALGGWLAASLAFGPYPLDASNIFLHWWQLKMSPNIARCSLGGKSPPAENHGFRAETTGLTDGLDVSGHGVMRTNFEFPLWVAHYTTLKGQLQTQPNMVPDFKKQTAKGGNPIVLQTNVKWQLW